MNATDHGAPRRTVRYRARLKGDVRRAKAHELAEGYRAGAPIRALAADSGLPYGTVRALLLEENVKLRSRGGRFRPDDPDGRNLHRPPAGAADTPTERHPS